MLSKPLSPSDISSILWDLKTVSIFFEDPLEVDIGGNLYSVGDGLGGFSWSFFQRGFDCTGCGNCCQSLHGEFNRQLWFWYPNEPHPGSLDSLQIRINGQPLEIHLHRNVSTTQCDFLGQRSWVPSEEQSEAYRGHKINLVLNEQGQVPIQYCTIHEPRLKPAHCVLYPGAVVAPTGKARLPLLSRRLPGRNWRWPQCPIDVTSIPLRAEDIENDRFVFDVFASNLKDFPKSRVSECLGIWERTVSQVQAGKIPTESIRFSEILGARG